MAASPSFHVFTFEGKVFTGAVTSFENVEGIVQFSYRYVEDGVAVGGSFTGEAQSDGTVRGGWKDQAQAPIKGRATWSGGAHLRIADADGRCSLIGAWEMPSISERWIIDVPSSGRG